MPFSAQPRHELEIDREIFRHNDISMKIITVFVWLLVIFCYAAPVYILKVIYDMYQAGFAEYHPDYDGMDAVYVYALIGGIFTPSVAFIVNSVTWSRYERWMTFEHKLVANKSMKKDFLEPSSSDDSEHVDYLPPAPTSRSFQ